MRLSKSLVSVAILVAAIGLCSLSIPPGDPEYKNLKVLPKKITHDQLDSVMKSFNKALGVKCNFCHVPRKDNPEKLDFASDEKEHKTVSRDMMRMTNRLNRKYFKGEQVPPVSCFTCHRGNEHPKTKPG